MIMMRMMIVVVDDDDYDDGDWWGRLCEVDVGRGRLTTAIL